MEEKKLAWAAIPTAYKAPPTENIKQKEQIKSFDWQVWYRTTTAKQGKLKLHKKNYIYR